MTSEETITEEILLDAYSRAPALTAAITRGRELGVGTVDEHFRLNELRALGQQMLGKAVVVKPIENPNKKISPIERFTEINELGVQTAAALEHNFGIQPARVEFRVNGGKRYIRGDSFYQRKRLRGKIVEADPTTGFMVVKPRFMGIFDRYWVRMIDDSGSPLVSVDFLDNK